MPLISFISTGYTPYATPDAPPHALFILVQKCNSVQRNKIKTGDNSDTRLTLHLSIFGDQKEEPAYWTLGYKRPQTICRPPSCRLSPPVELTTEAWIWANPAHQAFLLELLLNPTFSVAKISYYHAQTGILWGLCFCCLCRCSSALPVCFDLFSLASSISICSCLHSSLQKGMSPLQHRRIKSPSETLLQQKYTEPAKQAEAGKCLFTCT